MTRITPGLAAALTLISPSFAAADSFTPPNGPIQFEGDMVLSQSGVSLPPCLVAMHLSFHGTGALVLDARATGVFCVNWTFPNPPWGIEVVTPSGPPGEPATRLRLWNIRAQFYAPCFGDVLVDWNAGPPATITFPPGTTLPGGCGLSGVMEQVDGPPLTITK
ncbi:hypothetical protein [Caulobacter mirabilis]|uniref:Uncharacterized protein n=1 Tax=Caulobacter mirabilis TaxID=69666 RepID=A0A2D2AW93_9CAUL|nr:hypothetical protein [Caulobacter mirabilis]ATQ42266.1 hypothetical protein CSW64_07460 [Caulobacter mirabilis]